LHSGDIGELDEDGFLYIVDRKKDIIIRGGENISCLEVEAVMYRHADVKEVAVFGVPDERLGEVVYAVVMPKPGKRLSEEALSVFTRDYLASFKIPIRFLIQQDSLPKLASEKIFKRAISAKCTEDLGLWLSQFFVLLNWSRSP
jgi:long-chain acyl-CoA synthetase